MNGGHQLTHASKGTAANSPVCQLTEPDLDQVQPGGASGHEVKVEPGPLREPGFDLRMAVGAVVVEDQMQVEILGVGVIEPA
jgi:hypothetical protein